MGPGPDAGSSDWKSVLTSWSLICCRRGRSRRHSPLSATSYDYSFNTVRETLQFLPKNSRLGNHVTGNSRSSSGPTNERCSTSFVGALQPQARGGLAENIVH